MKLRKIISGGQTGADRTGLEEARKLGLETGGTAPKGWRIAGGTDPSLKDFGLVESSSSDYVPRTHQNAADADITLWFGKRSPGYWCTLQGCNKANKLLVENPTDTQVEFECFNNEIINIAGNRQHTNPAAVDAVRSAFRVIAKLMGK